MSETEKCAWLWPYAALLPIPTAIAIAYSYPTCGSFFVGTATLLNLFLMLHSNLKPVHIVYVEMGNKEDNLNEEKEDTQSDDDDTEVECVETDSHNESCEQPNVALHDHDEN
jgi:hypothetical protein